MSDERPEALLKSALEKIIYFEARSEQLSNDLATARAEAERLKAELAEASQREIGLRRLAAEYDVQASCAHREREELARMVEALKAERTNLIGRLLEAAQLHTAASEPDVDSPFDLASFIAQLRSEVLARDGAAAPIPARRAEAEPVPALAVAAAPSPAPASAVAQHAQRLLHEGRLHVSEQQLVALSREASFKGRTEETLFGFSLRELSSPEPAARARAAERLEALGNPAAAPALATALNAETEPAVLVRLLGAFATLARAEGVGVVAPHLRSPEPDVRIAALKALLALDPSQAAPHLSAAMRDPDPAVRRRASLLALGLPPADALALGEQAVGDADPDVRSLGALALGATSGESARPLLLRALRDPEPKVRQAAAQSLSRLLGEDVSGVATLDDVQRRREVRRLSTLPARPVRRPQAPAPRPRATATPATAHAARPAPAPLATAERTSAPAAPAGRSPAPVRPAPAAAPATAAAVHQAPLPPPQISEALCAALLAEIRCAIRGRPLPDLVAATREPPPAVEQACELLIARGQIVRRGQKYFVA